MRKLQFTHFLMACLTIRVACSVADEEKKKPPQPYAIRVTVAGKRAGSYSVYLKPTDCEVAGLHGWRFNRSDSVNTEKSSAKFKTRTRKLTPTQRKDESIPKQQAMGIDAFLMGRPDGILEVKASKISMTFEMRELVFGEPLEHDSGKMRIRRIPTPIPLGTQGTECDTASVAVDSKKKAWASWIQYTDKGQKLFLANVTPTGVGDVYDVTGKTGHYSPPITAVDDGDRIWVFFGMEVKGNIDLYARNLNALKWMPIDRVTKHPAPDINPSIYVDYKRKIWMVWQSARNGNYDIYMKHVHDATWSKEYRVTQTPENEWSPAVCVNKDGVAFVAYDVYRGSDYDIAMRKFVNEKFENAGFVTQTAKNETHVSMALDPKGRMWMAWEEGPENWGGPFPHGDGVPLHMPRTIRHKVIDEGEEQAAGDLAEALPFDLKEGNEAPQLTADAKGRVWLAFRHLSGGLTSRKLPGQNLLPLWESYVTYCSDKGWAEPLPLSRSEGRHDQLPSIYADKYGKVWVAWSGDGRQCWAKEVLPHRCTIHAALLEAAKGVAEPSPEAFDGEASKAKPRYTPSVGYGTHIAKKVYRLMFGDLNRPTEMSVQAEAGWGTYDDLFRYAWDPGRLDFAVVAENFLECTRPWPWRRAQSAARAYASPKRFVNLAANWRAAPFPIGSRVVVAESLTQPPLGIFYSDPRAKKVDENDAKKLWEAIKKETRARRLSIPVTPASKLGTDWSAGASPAEPVVEILSGAHWSYEQEGAPLAATHGSKTISEGFEAAGFVSNALAKGIKFGFVGGSGPNSSNCAFTGVYVEEPTPKGIFDALLARRCYAATDRIVLDYRVENHFMGEEFTLSGKPEFYIRVIGTDEIKELAVIKNGKPIHTTDPDGADIARSFKDEKAQAGKPAYYYVRVIQNNGKMAWGSPVWITVK